jgi:hypothetical protein
MTNAPAKFMASLTAAAEDLSLAYAGTPDGLARANLQAYLDRIEPGIAKELGPELAKKIIEALRAAVINRKTQIERSGASRA